MSNEQPEDDVVVATVVTSEVSAGDAPRKAYRKYETYDLPVDPRQGDRATALKLWSFKRPHMRAFHCSWFGFFLAFFQWFAIAPLLPEVRDTLDLTKQQIWNSNIASVAGTVAMRFINGPMCDKFGARLTMGAILCVSAIPTACIGFVQNSAGLIICRLFIGIAGSTFVMCQYWTSMMFAKNIVGTANAMAGGWGNLGGGVAQLIMGTCLYPLFKTGMSAETAWRTVSIVPAVVAASVGLTIIQISEDSPKGNYDKLKREGVMKEVSASNSFRQGAVNINTWLLFIIYGSCFGVELTMNNAAASYFVDNYGQTIEGAAAIASIFGFMNLFARGVGGFLSDKLFIKFSMKGRIMVLFTCLACEAALIIVFQSLNPDDGIGPAIAVLVFFSSFVQSAEGATYAIVPFVDPANTGSISGIVGAGGNIGAVCFGFVFREYSNDQNKAFLIMGIVVGAISLTCFLINVPGYAGILFGTENEAVANAQLAQTGGLNVKIDKNLQFKVGDLEQDPAELGPAIDGRVHTKMDLAG
ncbi:hypothetical protein TrST_g10640 [Triparma strigata]|uniref:Nitrate/nitrite transporter n=1 Tax=Triparma strigata TaxID=1606541 RepID=A0A9W7B6N2_9STRA|nr:hypothetical protein TrST_g10640 [Triparma strigata]